MASTGMAVTVACGGLEIHRLQSHLPFLFPQVVNESGGCVPAGEFWGIEMLGMCVCEGG